MRWRRSLQRGCWAPLGDKAAAIAAAVVVVVEHRVELWAWQWLLRQLMAGVFGIWCGRSKKLKEKHS